MIKFKMRHLIFAAKSDQTKSIIQNFRHFLLILLFTCNFQKVSGDPEWKEVFSTPLVLDFTKSEVRKACK